MTATVLAITSSRARASSPISRSAAVRRLFGALAVAVVALVVAVAPTPAIAATFTQYGPPNAGAWALSGHSVAGSSGTLPNDYPGPKPWNLPAGDYCSAYKFSQPSAPSTSAPLATVSDTNLAALTGFDPGLPRDPYQLRHNAQADSSACQAKGATWGLWTNANTANNYCPNWCGVRHDYSTGQATGTRPWSNGYGSGSKLVMTAFRYVATYSGNLGWSYICAMLQDTTTSQRLEYCLRLWRSWSGAAYDTPIVFRNPQINAGFTSVVTDVTATGTRYGQNWGGATTVLGTQPSGNTYSGAITRTHLSNAITDANAQIKAANLGGCIGLLNGIRCYSTDPDKYALFGVEDGVEIVGSGTSHLGGYSSGLRVYTDY
ncbi:MAG: hypothetical protein QOJ35_659 [Solirubrobacteraceae bacterium]|nr:hypothetical protein [Solirubrobacteraceae bacterium]